MAGKKDNEISVTATKNKRGRPKSIARQLGDIAFSQDRSERTRTGIIYCESTIELNEKEFMPFFVNKYGNFRRNGIAEQIGRMQKEGLATDEELIELTRQCIKDYENGEKIKDIEKRLRSLRIMLKA